MARLGQLLDGLSDGSDSDDGSFSAGSDSGSESGSSDASTQESNLSPYTGPAAEDPEAASSAEESDADDAAPGDDAAAAEAAAAKAEQIAAEPSPEPSPEPAPKKARAAAKAPADPSAGSTPGQIRAYLERYPASVRSNLTKRLETKLNQREQPGSGVEAAAKGGFVIPARSTDEGPEHCLVDNGKIIRVFKKPNGKYDFRACKESSEAFTEQALATFGTKKRKAPAPSGAGAAKKPASAAGPATKIDSIFNKSGAAAEPVPEPEPEPAAADAGIVPGPPPKPQTADAATDPMPEQEPEPKPAPKPAPKPVVARAPSAPPDPQVPAVAGGTTENPVSLYFTEGDPELVPRFGGDNDGPVVGFDAVRSTRKVLFDAGTPKKVVHYTLLRLQAHYPTAQIVYFVVGTTTTDTPMPWALAIDLVMMQI